MKNFISVKRIIDQLWYIISLKQKRQAAMVFVAMLGTSCLELLGVSAVYPLLQAITDYDGVQNQWYTEWLRAINPDINYRGILLILCAFLIFVFIAKNGLAIFFSFLQFRFASDFQKESSTVMLRKYMCRPYEFFINTNSSILFRGITSDAYSVYQILLCIFQAMGEMLTIVLIAVFLFLLDLWIAVWALMISGTCFLAIVGLFKSHSKKAGKIAREAWSLQVQYSYQAIDGIKEITVLDRKREFVNQFEQAARQYAKSQLTNSLIGACPDRILEGVCFSGFIVILCIRALSGNDIDTFVPIIGSFAMGAFKILPSISKLSSRVNSMIYYQPGLENCYDNYLEAARIEAENRSKGEECDECVFGENARGTSAFAKPRFDDSLTLSNICWKYRNTSDYVLNNLSIRIHKGESVAIIGSSGTGKSTLADILMGLLKPQFGTVKVDTVDIFEMLPSWHKMVGYVPQSVYLIDDTIRANIAFGLSKDLTDDDKIWNALEQAHLKDFVEGLPEGIDTLVGERGIKFSGGQRQRIALARALYEEPEILILDEATSSLDSGTEEAVMESIENLQGQKTLIIIAHRLTTIRNCDKIYEIVEGRALERMYSEILIND